MKHRVPIAIALSAAAIRLVPLQWLHPINWDELEFFRATKWIAEGRVPYRDFWEHHTPLAWLTTSCSAHTLRLKSGPLPSKHRWSYPHTV